MERFFSGLMRERGNHHHRVTSVELFYDLVFVFAVTQLSHFLMEHLTWSGLYQTGLLLLAMWLIWIYTTWMTNWLDPNRPPVRLALLSVMFAGLLMSSVLPDAFENRGLLFGVLYAATQIGRTLFIIRAVRDDPPLVRNFYRIAGWLAFSGIFWVAGGVAEGHSREVFWLIAIALDITGSFAGFYIPGYGRSTTHDWASISGGHLAERCQLFLIIALGESILSTGRTFSGLEANWAVVSAFIAAFIGSVALWWIYFDRSAEVAAEEIANSDDPGRLARSAYTVFHIPMIAGIIIASVGDELSIAHPRGRADWATVLVICGGPIIYLAGYMLFKYAVWRRVAPTKVVAIAALAVLIPVGKAMPPLVVGIVSTAILVGMIIYESGVMASFLRTTEPAASTSGVLAEEAPLISPMDDA